ncbi:MAG: OmpH family outer membrane protein [Oceanicaulis sp.]
MKRQFFAALRAPVRAIAAAAVAAVGFAAVAQAQVLVMNEAQVLSQSAAGQQIQTEITRIRNEELTPLNEEEGRLLNEQVALATETREMTEAEITARPDLETRSQALLTDTVSLEVRRAILQQELIATQEAAMAQVEEALFAVLQEIVDERGAQVLLRRSDVVYVADTSNITQTAIERLNARMPSVAVSRVRLNEEQRGQITQAVNNQVASNPEAYFGQVTARRAAILQQIAQQQQQQQQ